MYVCLLHVCWGLKRCEEGIGFPGTGVNDQPELILCDSGNQTWVFCTQLGLMPREEGAPPLALLTVACSDVLSYLRSCLTTEPEAEGQGYFSYRMPRSPGDRALNLGLHTDTI